MSKGFLTFAQNNSTTDYLRLAYAQALSIKLTQKINAYAVIVDEPTAQLVTDKHRKVFDHIIVLPTDDAANVEWKLHNEWQAFNLSPFKETLKVESDMLFTTSIDHWWPGMQKTDVCMTSHVRGYEGNVATSRAYRKLFDDNNLPDVYSGLMYFRYSQAASGFFGAAEAVYKHWPVFRDEVLINCRDEEPTTDVVFAIVALTVGPETCTNPGLSYPTFAHMKGAINGYGINDDWRDKLYAQIDDKHNLTVGFNRQFYPFHYHHKDWITDDMITRMEEAYDKR